MMLSFAISIFITWIYLIHKGNKMNNRTMSAIRMSRAFHEMPDGTINWVKKICFEHPIEMSNVEYTIHRDDALLLATESYKWLLRKIDDEGELKLETNLFY